MMKSKQLRSRPTYMMENVLAPIVMGTWRAMPLQGRWSVSHDNLKLLARL